MKYFMLVVCIILLGLIVGGIFFSPPSYLYKGLSSVSLQEADRLLRDKSESKEVQVFTYDEKQDKVYVSYNFRGSVADAVKYGIPSGEVESIWLNFGFIFVIAVWGIMVSLTIQEWRGKLCS